MLRSVKKSILSLLLAIAPFAILNTASVLFWDEPELPESLKEL